MNINMLKAVLEDFKPSWYFSSKWNNYHYNYIERHMGKSQLSINTFKILDGLYPSYLFKPGKKYNGNN